VAYNGKKVVALPRFARACATKFNFVDADRFNSNTIAHDNRIIKYHKRGFGVLLIKQSELLVGANSQAIHNAKSLAKMVTLKYRVSQKEEYLLLK
jgi:hypothetical protein